MTKNYAALATFVIAFVASSLLIYFESEATGLFFVVWSIMLLAATVGLTDVYARVQTRTCPADPDAANQFMLGLWLNNNNWFKWMWGWWFFTAFVDKFITHPARALPRTVPLHWLRSMLHVLNTGNWEAPVGDPTTMPWSNGTWIVHDTRNFYFYFGCVMILFYWREFKAAVHAGAHAVQSQAAAHAGAAAAHAAAGTTATVAMPAALVWLRGFLEHIIGIGIVSLILDQAYDWYKKRVA